MKVGFYNHTGKVSGAEHMLLLTLKALLAHSDYTCFVVCPQEGKLEEKVRGLGVPSFRVGDVLARFTYNPFKLVGYAVSIVKVLREVRRSLLQQNPDCIHANSVRAGIISTLATLGVDVPIIWHIHDMLPNHPVSWIIRMLAHMSTRVSLAACSNAAAATIRAPYGKGHRVEVIHNGIDMDRLVPDASIRRRKRAELGLSDKDFLVGTVGMLTRRKGQHDLIAAVKSIQPALPNLNVIIVGSPIFNQDHLYLDSLRRAAGSLQHVSALRFLGQRDDAAELIQAMDVFVLPSLKEPFAVVLLEAMALGKAVIATDCGGPREAINNGENGVLVPVGNPNALGLKLRELYDDPHLLSRLGYNAQQVRAHFNQTRYVEHWDAFYQSVARRGQPDNATSVVRAETMSTGQ